MPEVLKQTINKVCHPAWKYVPPPIVCLVIVKVKVPLSAFAHFLVLGLAIRNNKSVLLTGGKGGWERV